MTNKESLLGGWEWEETPADNSVEETPIIQSTIDTSSFFTNLQEEKLLETTTEVVDETTTETKEEQLSTEKTDWFDEVEEQSSYNEFITKLIEKGVINSYSEDLELEDSIKGVSDLITREKEFYFNSKLEGLSETTRKMVELELKGIIPEVVLDEFVDYSSIDLEDLENQENLLKEFYVKTGIYSENDENLDTKITNKLKNFDFIVLQETLEEAISYLSNKQKSDLDQKETLALQKAELTRKEQELENKQKYEEFKTKITSIRNIKGLEVSQKEAEELFSYMTVKDSKGKTQAEKDQTEEAWLFLEYVKMKKIDLSSLRREATTKATKQMHKKLLNLAPKGEINNITVQKEKEPQQPLNISFFNQLY